MCLQMGSYQLDHDEDSQWSEGLISAARMVAAATHSMCDAANAMVQGHASEEKLISSAKQVASSTAQLLVACKVKADVDSVAMRRLQVRAFEWRCVFVCVYVCGCLIVCSYMP